MTQAERMQQIFRLFLREMVLHYTPEELRNILENELQLDSDVAYLAALKREKKELKMELASLLELKINSNTIEELLDAIESWYEEVYDSVSV